MSPLRPPQPPTCAPQSTPCVMGAQWVPLVVMWGPDHHPLSTPSPPVPLSPSVCPHGAPSSPRCPIVPTTSPPPPQPPICAPQSALCAMGATGGDVGPSVTLSPLGCPQPHRVVPKAPHRPHGVPLSPSVCPHGAPSSPPCPPPSAPNLCPTEHPMCDGCAMGAAGGDVGPGVTLSPSGCPQPHPIVPMAPHCPHGAPLSPYGCPHGSPSSPPHPPLSPPSPQPLPHRAPHMQWVPPAVTRGPVTL